MLMSDQLYTAWYIIAALLVLILAVLIAILRRIPKPSKDIEIGFLQTSLDGIEKKLGMVGDTLDKIEMNTDTEWHERKRQRASEI
jgi:hypothetical protein